MGKGGLGRVQECRVRGAEGSGGFWPCFRQGGEKHRGVACDKKKNGLVKSSQE